MEWTQDHKHSARGRFSTILRFFEGIFQSMIMSNTALLDMLIHAVSSFKKCLIRNKGLNFGPFETQTVQSYFP